VRAVPRTGVVRLNTGIVYGCLTPHPPILVPDVGGRRVQQVGKTREAMQRVAADIAAIEPDVLVLVSPHAPINPYAMGIATSATYTGGFEAFGAPGPRIATCGDRVLVSEIQRACEAFGVPLSPMSRSREPHALDHGATVPLYFLQEAGVQCELVLLAFSELGVESHRRFGRAIAAAAKAAGKRAVLVASGDMSHRLVPGAPAGYSPNGKQLDGTLVSALRDGDYAAIFSIDPGLRDQAGECGYRSLLVALGAMPETKSEVLSYEGPFGVGYLVARFLVEPIPSGPSASAETERALSGLASEERAALDLARRAVESYVLEGRLVDGPRAPGGLLGERAGVFVSLKVGDELRGCIGTFQPCEPNVAAEIVRNAVASASRDPRFTRVSREELPSLSYSIDILSAPEPVDDPSELDPSKYGVIVQMGSRKGLLLPNLEGVSTVDVQLDIARRKAGISPGVPVRIHRFTVRRIK
jgi:AmmeMemoRadiSam system protein A